MKSNKSSPDNKSDLPQAVQACHALLLWIIPQLDKFPRVRRYTLGERIEKILLEVLELLLDAAYSKRPYVPLNKANLKLTVVRHLWRLAMELKAVNYNSYQYGNGLMRDIGRQTGGWQKWSDGR